MPKLKRIKPRIEREPWLRKLREQFPRIPKVRRGYWFCVKCKKAKPKRDFRMQRGHPYSTCKECEKDIK